MPNRRRRAAIIGLAAIAALLSTNTVSTATPVTADHGSGSTFAVIGDIPYGDAELARFPAVVDQLNHDRSVRWVAHLGDIKSGSTVCSDAYFAQIKNDFDQFADPLVYTIGDNEWTDCHRANNGGYDPLERLAAVRRTFFPRPGFTLGRPMRVSSDQAAGYPENVTFVRDRVVFASVHIVGSDNGLAPWTGKSAPTPEQTAEVLGRTASVIHEIRTTFDWARRARASAVVLLTQADMFDPTVTDPRFADSYAFQPIVETIATESARFGRPVYLFNGDSHVYNDDQPLAAGSRWLDFYRIGTPAPNLTRITVDGSDRADDYLRVTVRPGRADVLSWQRVPFR
ncbi:MAG TPA: hypothetical protein VFP34_18060 [Microlunatus sp.]|nr:hypothetical protein [Microlunatus sp.]